MKRVMAVLLCGLMFAAIIAGCKSQPQVSEDPLTGEWKEPLWVSKGIHAFPDEVGDALGGVGVAEKKIIPTLHMRRTAAEERARRAVAAQLRTMVMSVFKDYSEAAFTESMDEGQARQLTSVVQKSVIDEVVYGGQVRDVWNNPRTGDYYVFIRVGMDGVPERIRAKMIQLEEKRLRIDSEKAHQELDQIIDKHRQSMMAP